MYNVNTRGPVCRVDVDWRVTIRTLPPVLLLKNSTGTMLTSVPWVLQTVLRVCWISSESHSGQMWDLQCSAGWVFLGLTASGSILVHCSADSDRCWCYYLCFPFSRLVRGPYNILIWRLAVSQCTHPYTLLPRNTDTTLTVTIFIKTLFALINLAWFISVSYTHLDVYKRQTTHKCPHCLDTLQNHIQKPHLVLCYMMKLGKIILANMPYLKTL